MSWALGFRALRDLLGAAIFLSSLPFFAQLFAYERELDVFYSDSLEDFLIRSWDEEYIYQDKNGRILDSKEYLLALPFIFSKYLLEQGIFPEKLKHFLKDDLLKKDYLEIEISPELFNKNNIKLNPLINAAKINDELYYQPFLLEYKIRFRLRLPEPKTRAVESELALALASSSFSHPAQAIFQNLNLNKSFDDGLFIQDSENNLYHLMSFNKSFQMIFTGINAKINALFIEENEQGFIRGLMISEGKLYAMLYEDYKLVLIDGISYDFMKDRLTFIRNPASMSIGISSKGFAAGYKLGQDFSVQSSLRVEK